MRRNKVKKLTMRPRNWVVSVMIDHTKGGPMVNRKKEASKKKCRSKVDAEQI